jgi:hypothetical protein
MRKKEKKTGKEFEELIFGIYKELLPHAEVKWNDHILGRDSKVERQIDISIRLKIASHEILIIVQAKDQKKAADVNVLGEFESVIRDVGASKGILICNSGFTKSAKDFAISKKIDICSAHDAVKVNWQTRIEVPVIKKSISVKVAIRHTMVPLGNVTMDGVMLPDISDTFNIFLSAWEAGKLNKEPGEHRLTLNKDLLSQLNKEVIGLESYINYEISHRYHFKFFQPVDYRGIKDFLTKNFKPSFISFSETIPFLNDGTWKFVPDVSAVALNALHLNVEMVHFDIAKMHMVRIELKEPE